MFAQSTHFSIYGEILRIGLGLSSGDAANCDKETPCMRRRAYGSTHLLGKRPADVLAHQC